MLPLSRDTARKYELQRALAVYRMAFGQTRQEDLVAFLAATVIESDQQRLSADLVIDLSPPRSSARHQSGTVLGGCELCAYRVPPRQGKPS
jgi:hypothetical protein